MKVSSLTLRIVTTIVLAASLALIGQAQNREKFGISAKAGGINSVTGGVLVKRAGQTSQQPLTAQDELASGDVVSTGFGARAEVLLNPGSYLRVAENSEFELVDNSLDNLRVRLSKGSAIVEATGADETQLRIGIVTEQGRFAIVRRGIYRINILPGTTELLVQKGRILAEGQPGLIKSGNKVTFTNKSFVVAKLSKSERDEFDAWSKERAEFLARANQRLSIRTLNAYLFNSSWDWGFSARNRFGLWTYSPWASGYTFFPFHYRWASPYGGQYGRCGWLGYGFGGGGGGPVYSGPVIVGYPPPSSGGFSGAGSSGGSSGGPSGGSGPTGSPTGGPSPSQTAPQMTPRDSDSGMSVPRKP